MRLEIRCENCGASMRYCGHCENYACTRCNLYVTKVDALESGQAVE